MCHMSRAHITGHTDSMRLTITKPLAHACDVAANVRIAPESDSAGGLLGV